MTVLHHITDVDSKRLTGATQSGGRRLLHFHRVQPADDLPVTTSWLSVVATNKGQLVRVLDIAEKMIALSGSPIQILFRGSRPGEKLHERLFSVDADLLDTSHPLIWRASSLERNPTLLDAEEFLP